MDVMSIKTKFIRDWISKIVSRKIGKAIGIPIDVDIQKLEITQDPDDYTTTAEIHVRLTGATSTVLKALEGYCKFA